VNRKPKSYPFPGLEIAEALPRVVLANDLVEFTKQAWSILHPGRELIWSWHYDYLCEYLVLVKRRVSRRLIINVPPRTLKSTLVTIIFPVWVWLTEPSHHFLAASYNLDLSGEHSVKRRTLLQNAWFKDLSRNTFRLTGGRNRVEQFMNNKAGQMIATSVGATAWGRGGDTAIVDDPLSADQALSDTERTHASQWIDTVLRSRLNDPASGAIILVMQRLHELDPTGYLLEHEPGLWTHIRIPLEAEEDEKWVFPISGRIVERKAGEILMPERFTREAVEERRSKRLVFAGQYQQRPAPAEGNYVRRGEVRFYGGIDPRTGQPDELLPRNFDMKIISADCAYKNSATSDYVAIGVIGVKGRKKFVLNVINKHLDVTATVAEITRQSQIHQYVRAVLIEDAANGQAVIQLLQSHLANVVAITPQGGKTSRMHAAAVGWQAGDWYVDRNAGWAEPFIEQLMMFPNARNDDQVDMMTQAAVWLSENRHNDLGWRVTNAFTGAVIFDSNEG
jgi:predicted phage terminase large subunit-like protein